MNTQINNIHITNVCLYLLAKFKVNYQHNMIIVEKRRKINENSNVSLYLHPE